MPNLVYIDQGMRKIILLVTLLHLALAATGIAYISNWFRDDLLMHRSVFLVPIVISSVSVLIVAVFAFWQRSHFLTLGLVVIAAGSAAYIGNLHHDTYGSWFPTFAPAQVESSGVAILKTHGETLRYSLELHNTGEATHREILVVTRHGQDRRIVLPIFSDNQSGFVSPKTPQDWILLNSTGDADVFDVRTGRLLMVRKSFRVNLRTGEVTPK